jgi:hypothetical protein
VSAKSRTLINKARLEMEGRFDRAGKAVDTFFEQECSGSFLGLPQSAREHLQRFRAHLNSFYIREYGCWPPPEFKGEVVHTTYAAMFADIKCLYQHLADTSATDASEQKVSNSGGVCTLQNIQAFDNKHSYDPLAHVLPRLPEPFDTATLPRSASQRRLSWNPVLKRKAVKEARRAHDQRALVAASNRDVLLMDNALVRLYSEFEEASVQDDLEDLPASEARKVRWILIYAMLQTFRAVLEPPKEVRNTIDLTYSLCCRPPTKKPWQEERLPELLKLDLETSPLVPDNFYSHTNKSSSSLGENLKRGRSEKARPKTFPATPSGSVFNSGLSKPSPGPRSSSLKRLFKSRTIPEPPPPVPRKKISFCEIYVEGYGNGTNRVNITEKPAPKRAELESTNVVHELAADPIPISRTKTANKPALRLFTESPVSTASASPAGGSSPPSPNNPPSSVSDTDHHWNVRKNIVTLVEKLKADAVAKPGRRDIVDDCSVPIDHGLFVNNINNIAPQPPRHKRVDFVLPDEPEPDELPMNIEINTQTWDMMLENLPRQTAIRV